MATDLKVNISNIKSTRTNNLLDIADGKLYVAPAKFSDITGNATDNASLSSALNGKQDKLTAGNNITIDNSTNTISATNSTYTSGTGINIANNVINNTGVVKLTAGAGVGINGSNGEFTITNTQVSGITSVNHDSTLTGTGSDSDPLKVNRMTVTPEGTGVIHNENDGIGIMTNSTSDTSGSAINLPTGGAVGIVGKDSIILRTTPVTADSKSRIQLNSDGHSYLMNRTGGYFSVSDDHTRMGTDDFGININNANHATLPNTTQIHQKGTTIDLDGADVKIKATAETGKVILDGKVYLHGNEELERINAAGDIIGRIPHFPTDLTYNNGEMVVINTKDSAGRPNSLKSVPVPSGGNSFNPKATSDYGNKNINIASGTLLPDHDLEVVLNGLTPRAMYMVSIAIEISCNMPHKTSGSTASCFLDPMLDISDLNNQGNNTLHYHGSQLDILDHAISDEVPMIVSTCLVAKADGSITFDFSFSLSNTSVLDDNAMTIKTGSYAQINYAKLPFDLYT